MRRGSTWSTDPRRAQIVGGGQAGHLGEAVVAVDDEQRPRICARKRALLEPW